MRRIETCLQTVPRAFAIAFVFAWDWTATQEVEAQ